MNPEEKNNPYGAFELKKVYSKNYLIGVAAALILHLIIFLSFMILAPEKQNDETFNVKILKYAELGPPPSIIHNQRENEKVNPQKPTFGKPVAAKKGEQTSEFEVPKEGAGSGDVKVEPPKPEVRKEVIDETYYVAVDMMPEPNGGMESVQRKIVYPAAAKKEKVEGKVIVKAFIDESGTVRRTEIIKGIGSGCDEAALAAVMSSHFKPGRMNGKVVRVQMSIALEFKL